MLLRAKLLLILANPRGRRRKTEGLGWALSVTGPRANVEDWADSEQGLILAVIPALPPIDPHFAGGMS